MTKTTALAELTTPDYDADWIPMVDVDDLSMAASGTTKRILPDTLGAGLTAGLIGRSGFKFTTPDTEPVIGAVPVITAGSGFDFDLGWTDRTPLIDPEITATNDDQYLSPVGWKDITDVLEVIRTNNVFMGDNSIMPTFTGTRGLVIRGAGTSFGDYGSLVLGGSGSGTSLCGELKFVGGVERFARIVGKVVTGATVGSESTTGSGQLFLYTRLLGVEIPSVEVIGHAVNIGDLSGSAAGLLTARSFSFGAVSLPFQAVNTGNSTGGTGYGFQGCGTAGAILNTGNIAVRKTALTTTTSTADFIISLANASATPTEAARIKADGKLVLVGNQIGIATAQTPASAAATGTTGTICWDSGFLYVCTGTNAWKRVAIATW